MGEGGVTKVHLVFSSFSQLWRMCPYFGIDREHFGEHYRGPKVTLSQTAAVERLHNRSTSNLQTLVTDGFLLSNVERRLPHAFVTEPETSTALEPLPVLTYSFEMQPEMAVWPLLRVMMGCDGL